MKDRLKDLDLFKQAGNFSGLIVQILFMIAPYLEKKHFFETECEILKPMSIKVYITIR